jgi:hypothetical protein
LKERSTTLGAVTVMSVEVQTTRQPRLQRSEQMLAGSKQQCISGSVIGNI